MPVISHGELGRFGADLALIDFGKRSLFCSYYIQNIQHSSCDKFSQHALAKWIRACEVGAEAAAFSRQVVFPGGRGGCHRCFAGMWQASETAGRRVPSRFLNIERNFGSRDLSQLRMDNDRNPFRSCLLGVRSGIKGF